jgi:uncharacterized membrane protein YedE/YeeE
MESWTYWPGWLGGIGLAAVALSHWMWTRRLMAVSGRYTALVNRVRSGPDELVGANEEDVVAALREATVAEFGEEALADLPEPEAAPPALPRRDTTSHLLFLGGVALGGTVGSLMAGGWSPEFAMRGETFAGLFGTGPWVGPVVLGGGGILVGAGTRMAAGCTSGHGLCGVSRFQVGSIAATAAFFGTGIVVSIGLARLL